MDRLLQKWAKVMYNNISASVYVEVNGVHMQNSSNRARSQSLGEVCEHEQCLYKLVDTSGGRGTGFIALMHYSNCALRTAAVVIGG